MGVLHNATIWAREVTGQHRTIRYRDLVHIDASPPIWGVHDPISGEWIAMLTEAEALDFLREWRDAPPMSTILAPGRKRLEALTS